jgi:gamma-glutamylcyclotransferase (GGCT)/AIG2-like uncharacterized protein YtfP
VPPAPAVALFTYGTLQQSRVQFTVFQRELTGQPDTLRGYVLVPPGRGWRYPNITPSPDPNAAVPGIVYEISEEELARADVYEGSDYERISVTLGSGGTAWVYLLR